MKLLLLLFTFTLTTLSIAQTKEKSLLWEIKHPKSNKTSYIYGTMHISGKLAFHLGEEFFEAIESVDAIALESNPIIWLDEILNSIDARDYIGEYPIKYQTQKGFYQSDFKVEIPENNDFIESISTDHYLNNWMLYRSRNGQQDFQEETFLDLFIYQTGLKTNRKVYSLENFQQTNHFSKMSTMPDPDEKDNAAWYDKLLEEKGIYELIQDAYKNKDVHLLDSLHDQMSSKTSAYWMIDLRNDIMATRIDSFIQKENTSLFIGIGAAHLGGDKGVIEVLKSKGYLVSPVETTITDKAKSIKTAYDNKKVDLDYVNDFNTKLFSLKIPGKMYETPSSKKFEKQFFSPELTNGAYYMVKQISTYDYLKDTKQTDYTLKIDSILFESIPGKILSKKSITNNGFTGIDITNKTSSGNIQRYQIFFTPLQILIFKMGGKNNFVQTNGNSFFNSIKLNKLSSDWVYYSPKKGGFKVSVPNNYSVVGNNYVTSLYNHPELEAYDDKNKSYYYLKRASFFDFEFIEEDGYELDRILKQFCEGIDLESDSLEITILKDQSRPSAIGHLVMKNGKHLNIKIIINDAYYYLLVAVSPENKPNNPFFDSFTITPFNYNYKFETKTDSTLLFTTKSNYISPTKYVDIFEKTTNIYKSNTDKKKIDNSHKSENLTRIYYSENYEWIKVERHKFHDYKAYKNIDSLWRKQMKYVSDENYLILSDSLSSFKNNIHELEANFIDTNSSRLIKTKFIVKGGLLYTLFTTTDTTGQTSPFITEFYDSFTPLDTTIGISVFSNKSEQFFQAINSNDSIQKESAYNSLYSYIHFIDKDVDEIIQTIDHHNFPKIHIEVKEQLIEELGKLNDKRILPYLTQLYPKVADTALLQIAILKSISKQNTKKAYKTFTKLLDYDVPLSSDFWGINSLFYTFYDSLELAKYIFPKILDYSFIQSYKTPTYDLLSILIRADAIKSKYYKKNYKQILREAKIELKLQISEEQSEESNVSNNNYYYPDYNNSSNKLLVNYATLLIPFSNKIAVQNFYKKLESIKNYSVQTDLACLFALKGEKVDSSKWLFLASDIANRNYLYESLKNIDRLDLFPNKYATQEQMTESLLYDSYFDFETDSMAFIAKKLITIKGNEGYVYFYKSKKEDEDDYSLDYIGLQPKDTTQISNLDNIVKHGVKIDKHKTIDEIIEQELETIQLEGHLRAKKKTTNRPYYGYW